MNLSIVNQLHFLFSGGWPAIFAIVIGLSLLLTFQSFKKFRNFFGLAYLAIPGCTLAVFGILGIVYTGFEINNSVAKINLNSQQIMKDNESDIIAKIKNGFYVDAGKILESIKVKCDLDFITLSLIPSNELVAQIGNPKSDNQIKSSKYILSSTDIDGSTVEWGRLDFQLDHESLGAKIKEIADRIAIFMINMGLGSLVSSLLLAFYFFRHLKRPSIFVNNLRKAVTESSDVESLLKKMNSLDYDKAFLEEELQLKHNLKSITIGMTELQNRWLKNESEAVLGRMASQVSHDIRSPLSALTMLINQLTDVPEDKRTLIRSSFNRINDIANTLLEKSKAAFQASN